MPGRVSRRLATRQDDGVSLIETVVALFVVGIIMTAAAAFFINSLQNSSLQSQRQTATTVATQAIEATQAVPATKLVSGRSQSAVDALMATDPTRKFTQNDVYASTSWDASAAAGATGLIPTTQVKRVNNVDYTVRTFINICNLDSATQQCLATAPAGSVAVYRATVAVSWVPKAGATCPGGCLFTATTLFDKQEDPRFNSNISTPTLDVLSPSSILTDTATTLTLSGTSFRSGALVTIATDGGTFGSVISNTGTVIQIPFTSGSVSGGYTIAVTNPDGGRAVRDITVVPRPVITSITSPLTPFVANNVTINGSFFATTGVTVTMTGGTATVLSATATALTVRLTPDGSLGGNSTVTVTNPDTGAGAASATATTAISPTNPTITRDAQTGVARTGQPTTITLTGTDFAPALTVTPSNGTINSVVRNGLTSLTVTFTPATANASTTFTVRNPDARTAARAVVVATTPDPVITSAQQTGAPAFANQPTEVTLTGTGFVSGATVTSSSGTVGALTYNAGAGTYKFPFTPLSGTASFTFTLQNPDGGMSTISTTVTTKPGPSVTGVVNTAKDSSNKNVDSFRIDGSNFVGSTVTATYVNNGNTVAAPVSNLTQTGSTQLAFKVDLANNSFNKVITFKVTNSDGQFVTTTLTYTS